jgi:hypothetical protein
MVVMFGQQHVFVVEAPSACVPPHPGSHATQVGLYKIVAASNPSVSEEAEIWRPYVTRPQEESLASMPHRGQWH